VSVPDDLAVTYRLLGYLVVNTSTRALAELRHNLRAQTEPDPTDRQVAELLAAMIVDRRDGQARLARELAEHAQHPEPPEPAPSGRRARGRGTH